MVSLIITVIFGSRQTSLSAGVCDVGYGSSDFQDVFGTVKMSVSIFFPDSYFFRDYGKNLLRIQKT